MFSLWRPSPATVRALLQQQQTQPFTYEPVGGTLQDICPPGFAPNRWRQQLGQGETVYQLACSALGRWAMFNLGWVSVEPATAPIVEGTTVAILGRQGPLWSTNICRILTVVTEPNRFGFVYGTLPEHLARGEERFLIERDVHDAVWYDLYSFSRPRHPLAWLGLPLLRRLQRSFARISAAALQRASVAPAPETLV